MMSSVRSMASKCRPKSLFTQEAAACGLRTHAGCSLLIITLLPAGERAAAERKSSTVFELMFGICFQMLFELGTPRI